MSRPGRARVVALLAVCAAAAPAHAHNLGGNYGPLLHPLLVLEHGLALLALGLLAGQQGVAPARWVIGALLAGLLCGAALPALGVAPSWLDVVNIGSLVVLGGLVALAARLPRPLVVTLAIFFGLTHGAANAVDQTGTVPALLVVAGTAIAGLLVTLPASGIVATLAEGWPRIVVRVLGSWIAAIGLIMLGLMLQPLMVGL
jgi:urease accessory protein